MKINKFDKLLSFVILLIFTYTSCNVFSFPEILPSIHTVPVGLGNVGAVFLDENYNPTTDDIGILALYVENNKYAENIMVIAEIPDDHIDNNVVVRVINRENDSIVSFYYHSNQYFPYKMVIDADDQKVTGSFSLYNVLAQTYSVEFTDEEGYSEKVDDLFLNKNVFSLHEKSSLLTETQNVRLQRIYTTLSLWSSMAFQFDEMEEDAAPSLFFRGSWLKQLIVGVIVAVAVIAVVAVVVLAAPAAVTVAGPLVTVAITTTPQVVLTATAVVAAGAAVACNMLLPDDLGKPKPEPDPPPAVYRRSRVKITCEGESVENNPLKPYNLLRGESITFDIDITVYDDLYKDIIDINKIDTTIKYFDPYRNKYINETQANAAYFDFDPVFEDDELCKISITRKDEDGWDGLRTLQVIIQFKKDVIINGESEGIEFAHDLNTEEKVIRKDIFVIYISLFD